MRQYQSDAGSTKDTPYLSLTGELWGVFYEYSWENCPHCNSTTLYYYRMCIIICLRTVYKILSVLWDLASEIQICKWNRLYKW